MKNLLSISLFIFLSFNSYSQSCSGTPNGGNTVSNTTFACANDTIQLTVINSTIGNGLTYQWQWSADSTTWQDIAGITTDSFITQQTGTSYYRRIINCGDSNSFSVPVKVSAKPFLQCYCKPAASNCTQNDLIKKVEMATLSNSSTCSANGYIDYSGTVAAPSVNESTVLPVSVTVSAGGTEYVSMWIDYNQDGIFGADEYSSIGFGNGITITGLVHLRENIPTGLTKMRIRVRYGSNLNNTDACSTIAYGETEDYAINILPAPLCSTLPNGGITNASVPTVCPVDSITLTVSNATTGFTGLTYQWQQSADGIVWNNIAGDTNISVTLQQTTATYYRRMIACSSLQSYSAPVPVAMKDTNLCYCKPASSVCNTTATITSVRFGLWRLYSIATDTGAARNYYPNYRKRWFSQ